LLYLFTGFVHADWTGVSVQLANVDSDWEFDDGLREAQINGISFQVEEKTGTGLAVGVGIGYNSMRVVGDGSTENRKFDAEYLQIYLRQEINISKSVSLHGLFNYSYNTGDDNDDDNPADIDWDETSVQIDLNIRFANYALSPFAAYQDIDGDISDDNGTAVFKIDDPVSHGIRFDYYTEPTAFIRIVLQSGGQAGGYLTFVRRY
jgi:hypothetical protein